MLTYVKTYQIVHFINVQFLICQLYLNKAIKNICRMKVILQIHFPDLRFLLRETRVSKSRFGMVKDIFKKKFTHLLNKHCRTAHGKFWRHFQINATIYFILSLYHVYKLFSKDIICFQTSWGGCNKLPQCFDLHSFLLLSRGTYSFIV